MPKAKAKDIYTKAWYYIEQCTIYMDGIIVAARQDDYTILISEALRHTAFATQLFNKLKYLDINAIFVDYVFPYITDSFTVKDFSNSAEIEKAVYEAAQEVYSRM